jgi:hypothetical protein
MLINKKNIYADGIHEINNQQNKNAPYELLYTYKNNIINVKCCC